VTKSSRIRWAVLIAGIGESRDAERVFVGKGGVKRPLGKPKHRKIILN
jgi:hypothetical protein